jgi:N-acetylmuramoyl-L-alanine amidase
VLADTVRVTIELDGEVSFHDERLENPDRVFVDLAMTRAAPDFVDRTLRFEADADVVRQIRVGRHPNNTTRVVLDVAGISSYSVYPLYSPYRLVIDCIRATAESAAIVASPVLPTPKAPVAPPVLPGRHLAVAWARSLPTISPRTGSALREARVQDSPPLLAANEIAPALTVPARPPTTNLDGGFSIARQLGLGISRIVIDPGH